MAACAAAITLRHVGGSPGLVEENQPRRVQFRLPLAPFAAGLSDIRAVLLGRVVRLFLSAKPR
jgi:hypothetical protein